MTRLSAYIVFVKRSAEKDLDALPRPVFDRISSAILKLESVPRPRGAVKLRGGDEYPLRVGDYRVLYVVDDDRRTVHILAGGHRREVYRGL